MEPQLERALPVVAVWGGWILGALLLATSLGLFDSVTSPLFQLLMRMPASSQSTRRQH